MKFDVSIFYTVFLLITISKTTAQTVDSSYKYNPIICKVEKTKKHLEFKMHPTFNTSNNYNVEVILKISKKDTALTVLVNEGESIQINSRYYLFSDKTKNYLTIDTVKIDTLEKNNITMIEKRYSNKYIDIDSIFKKEGQIFKIHSYSFDNQNRNTNITKSYYKISNGLLDSLAVIDQINPTITKIVKYKYSENYKIAKEYRLLKNNKVKLISETKHDYTDYVGVFWKKLYSGKNRTIEYQTWESGGSYKLIIPSKLKKEVFENIYQFNKIFSNRRLMDILYKNFYQKEYDLKRKLSQK